MTMSFRQTLLFPAGLYPFYPNISFVLLTGVTQSHLERFEQQNSYTLNTYRPNLFVQLSWEKNSVYFIAPNRGRSGSAFAAVPGCYLGSRLQEVMLSNCSVPCASHQDSVYHHMLCLLALLPGDSLGAGCRRDGLTWR